MTNITVPNEFPLVNPDARRLAIVGEAPGNYEIQLGRPFVGPSGNLLNAALQGAGMMRSQCFVGNVCQHQPEDNNIENFDKAGHEIQDGLEKLKQDLNRFQPNCVLLLGNTALWASGSFFKVSVFRGSMFMGFNGRYKCIASYHPAAVQRQWDFSPEFNFDVNRAVQQSSTKELILPQRTLLTTLTPAEILLELKAIQENQLISIDIEGGVPNPNAAKTEYRFLNGITCISISTDPTRSFIIPFENYDDDTKANMLKALAGIMANPKIPKLLQNGLYDVTVMAHHWKMPVRGLAHDTMLSGWEIYPELEKGLGVQASIWTLEPYYKYERTSGGDLPEYERKQQHYAYCCKDSAVTYEIHNNHMAAMNDDQRRHYNFNVQLLQPLQFMSLRGIRYDRKFVSEKAGEIQAQMLEMQTACNTLAGQEININSSKQMIDLLYRKLGFEPQYKIEKGRKTNKLTADIDALLTLVVKNGNDCHPFLKCALAWKKLESIRRQLEWQTDPDGRIRCSYNLVGADTGRLSCSTSVTGSGNNLQTCMKVVRKAYIADEGMYFFQCDLSGADGWTVAAHCASLGDSTMIDDYYAGIKPAKVIALMHLASLPTWTGPQISSLSREELKKLIKATDIPNHIYETCKAVQHGSNYLMKGKTMSENILEKSFKKNDELTILFVPPRDCTMLQNLYFKRYPGVEAWQRMVEHQLRKNSILGSASGHTRTFFGRPGDAATHRSACSHEPQANTTYATNLAMLNLWQDQSNRDSSGALIIQPLHSVHDALCGEFPIDKAEESVEKIRGYFNNTLRIGNEQIVIPFEGGYGLSWLETDEKYRIGEI